MIYWGSKHFPPSCSTNRGCKVSTQSAEEPDYCVTMYDEETLNPVQSWLPGFTGTCRYTRFGMASYSVSLHRLAFCSV